MQGSSRETAHSWRIVGTQLENHMEQGANSRVSGRQQQGRRGVLPWVPPWCNWPNDSWPDGAHRTPAISALSSINGVLPSRSSYHSGKVLSITDHSFWRRANCVCSVQPELTQRAVMQPLPEPGEAEKHALQHAGRTDMSHKKKNITTDSWIEVSARSQCAPRRGGVEEISMSSCMCEPMEIAQSLGDDTHAVVARTKWESEHGVHTVWFCVGGLSAWPIDGARTRLWSRSERETPIP